ncbi:G1 family glutamic endopeptidase [Gorillibacterium massiliense]|uniref:G1 family glutamic endopeptidase n=1 Tax=Gorillibacterium massiliense TaxID=1280390 RepID=UPI0009DC9F6E|nr:G1 family glutamic endopeptidase [Gorillibacterium massiliense]
MTRILPTVLPGWKSGNWSGYAINKTKRNSFRSISSYWVVPRVRASKQNKYSSIWVGIDGFGNSSLIQTGTEQDYVKGKAVYYPWWEILPAPETRIPYPVSPNDLMYANISKLGNSKWQIVLKNKTKGWTFRTIRTYTGPANTAEWIMEAPTVNNNTALLADYRKMGFKSCRLNNKNPILQRSNRGVMVQNGRVVSTPSLPNKSRDGFTVTYGSHIPLSAKSIRK